ncbi:MAG: hypothetical protein J5855_06290 [Mailhella sp.]|nr:hypothetical protein [Mailhella sp.]
MFGYPGKRPEKALPVSVFLLPLCIFVDLNGCFQASDQSGYDGSPFSTRRLQTEKLPCRLSPLMQRKVNSNGVAQPKTNTIGGYRGT